MCLEEYRYVLEKCEEERVDAILHSGDFFDSPDVSLELVGKFITLMREIPIPTYITLGQHDLRGHNTNNYRSCPIGVMEAAGVVKVLHHGQRAKGLGGIRGFGFGEKETEQLLAGEIESDDAMNIGLVHATVCTKERTSFPGMIEASALPIPPNWLLLFGDVHCGFDPIELDNGSVLANIGSFARKNWDDQGRPTRFIIIDTETMEFQNMRVPQPSDDVLFVDNRIRAEKEDIAGVSAEFKEQLAAIVGTKHKSAEEIVREVAELTGASQNAVGTLIGVLP
jgi:DNA repair exonuclease SbcCD nuclease subunit